jgi:adenylate cyclase
MDQMDWMDGKDTETIDDLWYWYLTGEKRATFPAEYERVFESYRRVYKLFPGDPRCFECDIPLGGLASLVLRPWGSRPSSFSPRFCSHCEGFARSREAGAEVELSLLFADVRDSTGLAEKIGTFKFKELIKRFYKASSEVLIEHNAMVNRLMGDQVIALFVPRFAGHDHAKVAIQAAQGLLQATGHNDPAGPWISVGIGVHTGKAFVGVVGSSEGVNEIAVLGSAANLAARLSSQAAAGEVLISSDAVQSAGFNAGGLESRTLSLKGISTPVVTSVLAARVSV